MFVVERLAAVVTFDVAAAVVDSEVGDGVADA
jgi:hypothetical protein